MANFLSGLPAASFTCSRGSIDSTRVCFSAGGPSQAITAAIRTLSLCSQTRRRRNEHLNPMRGPGANILFGTTF
jgi:hypothetical protein